jgi:hypothetical protein
MKNILLLFSALMILSGCKKTVDALPEATQTGANTFGLKLNDAFWVPQTFAGINTPILEAVYTGLGDLRINARNFASEPTETEFEIYLKNATGPGVYQLNATTDIYPNVSGSYAYYVKRKINPLNEWITSPKYTGTVTITKLDLTNHIASGSFEFTAGSIDSSATPITVTEGRFDVKLQ